MFAGFNKVAMGRIFYDVTFVCISATYSFGFMAAKKLLDDKGLSYEEINIDEIGISREDLFKLTGGYTVPQIIMNDIPIGGFDQLLILNQRGELKDLGGQN